MSLYTEYQIILSDIIFIDELISNINTSERSEWVLIFDIYEAIKWYHEKKWSDIGFIPWLQTVFSLQVHKNKISGLFPNNITGAKFKSVYQPDMRLINDISRIFGWYQPHIRLINDFLKNITRISIIWEISLAVIVQII